MRLTLQSRDWVKQPFLMWVGLIQSSEDLHKTKTKMKGNSSCWLRVLGHWSFFASALKLKNWFLVCLRSTDFQNRTYTISSPERISSFLTVDVRTSQTPQAPILLINLSLCEGMYVFVCIYTHTYTYTYKYLHICIISCWSFFSGEL